MHMRFLKSHAPQAGALKRTMIHGAKLKTNKLKRLFEQGGGPIIQP
jgi:hypothetical protein